jgi:hypothetical protein
MTSTAPDAVGGAPPTLKNATARGDAAAEWCAKAEQSGARLARCRWLPYAESQGADATCPAAAIGKQLAAVSDRLEEVEDLADREDSALLRRDLAHLRALRTHLLGDVEWVTPTSIDGLMVVAFAIREAVESVMARAGDRVDFEGAEDERRFSRMMQRLIEGLSGLARHDPSDIGLGHFGADVCAVSPDRSTLVACAACQINPRRGVLPDAGRAQGASTVGTGGA